ncbi:MAG: hypothetical protein ACRDWS_06435 [Acidimicrobiia bacterium]
MIRFAALFLFAVELGAGFGAATATVVSASEQSMIVDLRVEVAVSADSVVVHLALPEEDTVTIPMVPRDDGTYGVTTEIKPADYVVVFEALGNPGALSEPVSLTVIGVDLGPDPLSPETTESEVRSPGTQRWLWLGVALGAASLSVLAFWVLGGRDEGDGDEEVDGDRAQSAPEEEPSAR